MSQTSEASCEDKTKQNSWRPRQQEQQRRGIPLKACRNCGRTWKYEHYCPAEEETCQLCGKIGHYARVCCSGQNNDRNYSSRYNNNNFGRRNDYQGHQRREQSKQADNGSDDAPNNLKNNNNHFGNWKFNNKNENKNNATKNEDLKSNSGEQGTHDRERKTFPKNNNKNYQNNRRNNYWKNDNKNNRGKPEDEEEFRENEEKEGKNDRDSKDEKKEENPQNDNNSENDKKDFDGKSKEFDKSNRNNKNYRKQNNWRKGDNRSDKDQFKKTNHRSKNYKKNDGDGKMFDKDNKDDDSKAFSGAKNDDNESKNSKNDHSEEKSNSDSKESPNGRNTSYSFAGDNQPAFGKDTKYAHTSVGQARYDPRANSAKSSNLENGNSTRNEKETPKTPGYSSQLRNNYDSIGLKRKLANSFYQKGKYGAAMSHYSRLIELCPKDPVNFNNRCACYMAMGQYNNAFTDAVTVVNLDPSSVKGYCRLIKCAILLGNLIAAESNLSKLSQLDSKNPMILEERKKLRDLQENTEKEKVAANSKNYNSSLGYINKCLIISPHSLSYKMRKAEYLAELKRHDETQRIVDEILEKDPNNVGAKYISGIHLYYSDIDEAVNYFKNLLRLDPDHAKTVELYKKAKKILDTKKNGNEAFASQNFTVAHRLYSSALEIDKDHTRIKVKLFYNMGQASYNIGDFKRAIKEYTEAINIDKSNFKALKRRGKSYMEMKDYEEAIADFSRVCKLNPGDDCQTLIEEAEKLLASVKKDFYEILGVSRDASIEEVKKAYKDKAMLHHPDRHSNDTEEQKRKHERKFKDITLAYRDVLEKCKRKLGFTGNAPSV